VARQPQELRVGVQPRDPVAGRERKRLEPAPKTPVKARLVELRFFAGLTLEQAAECLGISLSTADRSWRYARAWLYTAMRGKPETK
jgi:DNA-directed RNA polymerase specialized sigma24 family protein